MGLHIGQTIHEFLHGYTKPLPPAYSRDHSSVSLGREAAHAYLQAQGGSMDSAQFVIMVQESIHTYRWTGGLLSLLGGFGFIQALELR